MTCTGSSSSSSNSATVFLAVILPVIAVITLFGVIFLVVGVFIGKKKAKNSPRVYEADDEPTLTRNGIGFENLAYISTEEISHGKDTDKVLYKINRSSHATEDAKLDSQQ